MPYAIAKKYHTVDNVTIYKIVKVFDKGTPKMEDLPDILDEYVMKHPQEVTSVLDLIIVYSD